MDSKLPQGGSVSEAFEPVALREALIEKAATLFDRSEVARAIDVLMGLRAATIDEDTLIRTDGYLRQVASGRRLVATCDPRRVPRDDEVVVIYGNYPHIFENVIVNNPIKRHVAAFGEWAYDEVE